MGHRGKIIEEFRDRMATLQVIDKSAEGYARADEDRNAAKNLGIRMDDRRRLAHAFIVRGEGLLKPEFASNGWCGSWLPKPQFRGV